MQGIDKRGKVGKKKKQARGDNGLGSADLSQSEKQTGGRSKKKIFLRKGGGESR